MYYKKSTDKSYTYLTATTGLSSSKANLADGVKYTFKVVAYKKVNGYECDNTGITTSIYTLKKISDPKMVRSGNKITVKWTNISGESGYQISKSSSKTGTSIAATYATTTGSTKTICVPQGKNYYYKVRAYKTVDGKKIYGPWSNAVWYKKYPSISYKVTPMCKVYYQDCGLVGMTICEQYFETQGKGAYKDLVKKEKTAKNKVKALYKKNGGVTCRWNLIKYNKVSSGYYDDIYTALEKGPVIVHKTSNHYSVVYAYTGSKTKLEAKGFQMIEVYNGKKTNLSAWLNGGINGRGRLDQIIGRK